MVSVGSHHDASAHTHHGGALRRARDALFDFFGVGGSVFGWSRWRGRCETQHLRVRMYTHRWHYDEGMDLLASDTIYVAFAAGFVWVYLALHFRSLPLATIGMIQILMSLPLALLFYPFRFIREHLIAIFLSLGVGADDLFVFVHAWRRAGRLKGRARASWNPRRLLRSPRPSLEPSSAPPTCCLER